MKNFRLLALLAAPLLMFANPAQAQDQSQDPAVAQAQAAQGGEIAAPAPPRSFNAPVRIIPVAGASSFTTGSRATFERLDETFSVGLLADFGSGAWNFETGVLTLQSSADRTADTASINIDSWGIPLLAKLNFSGKPHETVFLKLGAMPFTSTGDEEDFDIMAVGGIGGAIPLGRNSSLILDATYNRLLTTGGDVTDYQGFALLAGFSFNI